MEHICRYQSPVGRIYLTAEDDAITGLWIEGQSGFAKLDQQWEKDDNAPVFRQAAAWLDAYFGDPGAPQRDCKMKADALPPLPKIAPKGSAFQQRVWKILQEIPYGELTTYGAIAKRIASETGKKVMSAQAVGGAVGSNPISIMIPCHRVIGQGGNLTGYGGGLDTKVALLTLEGIDTSKMRRPTKGRFADPKEAKEAVK